ncbi:MAG: hypothetical protein L0Z48_08365, partial [candidate division Zixibacteria bacterium]|nr:hypothetical protein [candidate division Zixibacteria bacterium]
MQEMEPVQWLATAVGAAIRYPTPNAAKNTATRITPKIRFILSHLPCGLGFNNKKADHFLLAGLKLSNKQDAICLVSCVL